MILFFVSSSSQYINSTTIFSPTKRQINEKILTIQQCRGCFARVRFETFHLELELSNFRVGLAQFGVELVIIIL
jgi:hypothetical protein